MRFLVIFFYVFVASTYGMDKEFAQKLVDEMQQVGEKCRGETQANMDDLNGILSQKIPASHEGQCLLFCIHKHYTFQNTDGSVNLEGGKASLDRIKDADMEMYGKLLEIVTICGTQADAVDADPCVTAANLANCLIKETQKMNLPVYTLEI